MEEAKSVARELVCEIPGVNIYSDGTVDRSTHDQFLPTTPSHPDQPLYGAVSKDVTIDVSLTGIWVRIYLPQGAAKHDSQTNGELHEVSRLPIVVYVHGGGFILASAASSFAHDICCKICSKLNVIVVSVNFRLAPEHRLPAAFDDTFTALKWLQSQASEKAASEKEPWLAAHGNFGQCFLMGQGSGATIVHHVALRCSTEDMLPLQIRGLVMDIPFFGGLDRTDSEIKFGNTYVDGVLQVKLSDDFWAFSLPVGADRSHPYSDFRSSEAPDLSQFKLPPFLIAVGRQDPCYDREILYVEALRRGGHEVRLLDYPEKDHAIYFPEVEGDMENAYAIYRNFIVTCTNQSSNSTI